VAGERQWCTGKLPKGLWWCGENCKGATHGKQKGAGVGGDGGGGARGPG
jgi:hypothetical protein